MKAEAWGLKYSMKPSDRADQTMTGRLSAKMRKVSSLCSSVFITFCSGGDLVGSQGHRGAPVYPQKAVPHCLTKRQSFKHLPLPVSRKAEKWPPRSSGTGCFQNSSKQMMSKDCQCRIEGISLRLGETSILTSKSLQLPAKVSCPHSTPFSVAAESFLDKKSKTHRSGRHVCRAIVIFASLI